MDLIVTTVYDPSSDVAELGHYLANTLNAPFIERERRSLAVIREQNGVDNVLVASKKGPVIHTTRGEYFFHLSMADLRIKNLKDGKPDHMVAAMGLAEGMSVLDCTLGLASDAVVASFVTGELGRIVGLESAPVIALIARLGLQNFNAEDEHITQALRRIIVINADYNQYLATLPDKSFDVVYFDPMFRQPVYKSSNIKPLRSLADIRPLTLAAVQEACRVAKKRVVVKEAHGSKEFERLEFSALLGGKHSSIQYGVIELGG